MSVEDPDRLVLLDFLVAAGVPAEHIERADRQASLGALVVEASTGLPGTISFEEAAGTAGVTVAEAAASWQALGFPDPALAAPMLRPDEVGALALIARAGRDMLGRDAALALARVLGEASSRVADAVVDAFRAQVEAPQRSAGAPYADVVRVYSELVGTALPELQAAMAACLRRHLVGAAAGTWTLAEDETVPRRELVIAFVDLVGWTSLARTLSPSDLTAVVRRFEHHLAAAADSYRVRVVKLLGDGAMVVSPDAGAVCAFGLRLAADIEADESLPPVRVGLAAGPVVTLNGDYHGPVVNLAARLAAAAAPSTVLADEEACSRAPSVRFGRPAAVELRGFVGPLTAVPVLAAEQRQ